MANLNEQESKKNILMLGYLCIKDLKTLPEKVEVLDRFNLPGPDIAQICGCADQSVRAARLKTKKKPLE